VRKAANFLHLPPCLLTLIDSDISAYTMPLIDTVEKLIPVIKESVTAPTLKDLVGCCQCRIKQQLFQEQPLEGAVRNVQPSSEHVPVEQPASSSLCKHAADGREAQQTFPFLPAQPLQNKPGFFPSILFARQSKDRPQNGLIVKEASLLRMGNQDGKLKRSSGDVQEASEPGPKDGENTKKGGKRTLGKRGEQSGKKRSKSEPRSSVFSNLRIRKTLSRAKDGTSDSKEDVLGSQALHTEELDSTYSVVTKTPDISISADEGGLSDTDADPFEIPHDTQAIATAGEAQEGPRTSSGSDTDIYSFHSATEQDDLLSDIQQTIKLQHEQHPHQGTCATETDCLLLSKALGGHLVSSHTLFLDAAEQVIAFDKESIVDTDLSNLTAAQAQDHENWVGATEIKCDVKEASDLTRGPHLKEESRGLTCGTDAVAIEINVSSLLAKTVHAGEDKVLVGVGLTDIAINNLLADHNMANQNVLKEETDGLFCESKNHMMDSAVGETQSRYPVSSNFAGVKPYPPINPCYIKTTTRQLSSPTHSPFASPSQSPKFHRKQGQFFKQEHLKSRKKRSSSLAGVVSRSADWTDELTREQSRDLRKGNSTDYLVYRAHGKKTGAESLPSVSRKSSSVQATAQSFPNVFTGRTLLEKLFKQQEKAPEEAEKLCSQIIAVGLLLPFSDCFREQCSKSAPQIPSTFN
ncbi:hypothetical protein FKM82_023557, partial [Ascaphus truei]